MKIFLMTSPVDFAGEQEFIEQMFEKFPFMLQVRKPGYTDSKMEKFLLSLAPEVRESAILHGNPEMAKSFSMAGFCEKAPFFEKNNVVSDLKNYAFCESIAALEQLPKEISGAFLYPIFDSLTEPAIKSGFSDGVKLSKLPFDVFACGGVSEDEFKELLQNGFSGACVCGSVWNYADPIVAWNRITRMAFRLSQ
ncbi:MAG: hypothetical protein IIU83_10250 [Fibrobacteraceae bacterium]|nr:hypothetical protein [Fibrobacteraceae bacterium]